MTSQRRNTRCVSAVARPWMLVSGRLGSSPEVSIACSNFVVFISLAAAIRKLCIVGKKANEQTLV